MSRARGYYGAGLKGYGAANNLYENMMGMGGEPGYVRKGWEAQRAVNTTNITDQQAGKFGLQARQLRGSGNIGAQMNMFGQGAELANMTAGSYQSEGNAQIESMGQAVTGLMGLSMGAGNMGVQAGQNQLNAIGQMPKYSEGLQYGLGAANAAYGIYGAGNKKGWWDPASAQGSPGGYDENLGGYNF